MRSSFIGLLAGVMAVATAACTTTVDQHGNAPPPERLEMIKVGRFTRGDVAETLGTPSNTSTFGDDTWYYISNKVESWAFLKPEEIERQVVAIDFDRQGRVKSIRKLSLDDGTAITMASKETPTAGHDLGVLEQLLGNVGRFSNSSKTGPGGGGGS